MRTLLSTVVAAIAFTAIPVSVDAAPSQATKAVIKKANRKSLVLRTAALAPATAKAEETTAQPGTQSAVPVTSTGAPPIPDSQANAPKNPPPKKPKPVSKK